MIATVQRSPDLALLHVWVEDRDGRPITGRSREYFEVYEDSAEREIAFFVEQSGDALTPCSIVLALDTGHLGETKLAAAKQAIFSFIREAPSPAEIAFLSFAADLEILCPFTANRDRMRARVDAALGSAGAVLHDAIHESLEMLDGARHRRRILVVTSGGRDTESRVSFGELERRVQLSPAVVFALGLFSTTDPSLHLADDHGKILVNEGNPAQALRRLAADSGGRAVFPPRASLVRHELSAIAHELRHHYVLGYVTPPLEEEPRFHPIEVRVRPGKASAPIRVRARRGFLR